MKIFNVIDKSEMSFKPEVSFVKDVTAFKKSRAKKQVQDFLNPTHKYNKKSQNTINTLLDNDEQENDELTNPSHKSDEESDDGNADTILDF